MYIHNKEKKLNQGICSQVSYLPIHGTNSQTIDCKHLEGNKDMSGIASTDLSLADHLKTISFPSETKQQTLWLVKKQWVFLCCFIRHCHKQPRETRMRGNNCFRSVQSWLASCNQRAVTNVNCETERAF